MAAGVYGSLSLDNPVFRVFIGHVALVILKTFAIALSTSYYRVTRKIFTFHEDKTFFEVPKENKPADELDVERVKKIHLNDLENVLPFVLLGLLYVTTGPSVGVAATHFRLFTAARFFHTFVYFFGVRQPFRALSFFAGIFVCISMAFQILAQAAF